MKQPSVIVMSGRGSVLYRAEAKKQNEQNLDWRSTNRQSILILPIIKQLKEEVK
jgi:hypothetical protein